MRKIILSITIILCALASVSAQDSTLVTKKGIRILPKAGDLAIGIDANPFFSYLGNFIMGGGSNSAPTINFLGNNSSQNATAVYAKYFTSDKTALRFRLQFDNSKTINKAYVTDDNDATGIAKVADQQTINVNNYEFALGYEWRRGRTRLQGFYGAQALVTYSNEKYKYEYANPITEANQSPTTHNFGSNLSSGSGYRVLTDNRGGSTFGCGAGAFIGVEYFVLPAISLGAELSWNLLYTRSKQTKLTSEIWNGTSVETRTDIITPSTSSFETGTSNPSFENNANGHLYLMFHF
jgi:hypothetical protein